MKLTNGDLIVCDKDENAWVKIKACKFLYLYKILQINMTYINLKRMIKNASDKDQAEILQRFFKTGKGGYGEGDKFRGIKVPIIRKIAFENLDLSYDEIKSLLGSNYHEERLAALLILVKLFSKAGADGKVEIFNFYLTNMAGINNWDLVDLSAPAVIGAFLIDKDKSILYDLAKSQNLWEKRISIISSFYFIKNNEFDITLRLAEILLEDTHDLIHKAVGWMLREIGKRNLETEEIFLRKHYKQMPRTMLRYAIEKFPEKKRQAYLKGKI